MLISRLIDRPLRPMLAKGWANDTQVLQWVLSYDGQTLPEPLAITAAGAALLPPPFFSPAASRLRYSTLEPLSVYCCTPATSAPP